MKTCLHLILICVALVTPAKAQNAQKPHPGAEPYMPTKIEWLMVVLQAELPSDVTEESKFRVSIAAKDPETIVIHVRYQPKVWREGMNTEIASARNVIMSTAKRYGWESWVKIEEDVQVAGSPLLKKTR